MKKIIYLFAVLGLIFTSACTPMDDIHADIDAKVNPIIGDATFTLTDEDYDALGLSYGSFSSLDDAKAELPAFLAGKYPVWGKNSSALVGYKLYVGSPFGVDDYTLDQDDYTFSGSDLPGFQSDVTPADFLVDILADNFSSPSIGDYVMAKYDQYTGAVLVVTPTVTLEENFDYGAVAGDLTTISGGDWISHSGTANELGYAVSSLSMTDYPSTDIGGSITLSSAGSEDVNKPFAPVTSGKVYASALMNLSTIGDGTYFFHFMDDGYGYSARVGAKDDGSGNILFGIGATSSTLSYGSTAFDLNTTYLVVASYDIATGISNLYVLTSAETTEPDTPEATNTGDADKGIEKIGVRQGYGGPTATIDGIRVANTWSSIMSNEVLEDEVFGDKESNEMFYTYTGETWDLPSDEFYFITGDDFDSMGDSYGQPGYYNNFGSTIPPNDYLPTFLGIKFPYAMEGDVMEVVYDYYSSSSGAQLRGNLYTVIDGAWVGYESTINTTLQFGHDGNVWVPDNTIKYTFGAADYAYVVDNFTAAYPSETGNLDSYGNFNMFSWTDDMVLEVVGAVLLNNFPGMADGQKFTVTISVYDGSTHDVTLYLVLSGGAYVNQ